MRYSMKGLQHPKSGSSFLLPALRSAVLVLPAGETGPISPEFVENSAEAYVRLNSSDVEYLKSRGCRSFPTKLPLYSMSRIVGGEERCSFFVFPSTDEDFAVPVTIGGQLLTPVQVDQEHYFHIRSQGIRVLLPHHVVNTSQQRRGAQTDDLAEQKIVAERIGDEIACRVRKEVETEARHAVRKIDKLCAYAEHVVSMFASLRGTPEGEVVCKSMDREVTQARALANDSTQSLEQRTWDYYARRRRVSMLTQCLLDVDASTD